MTSLSPLDHAKSLSEQTGQLDRELCPTPLHFYAFNGDAKGVDAFLKSLPDRESCVAVINQKNNTKSSTAAHLAALHGSVKVMDVLFAFFKGDDEATDKLLWEVDAEGQTIFHLSAKRNTALVKKLFDSIDVGKCSMALNRGGEFTEEERIKMLSLPDNKGRTAAHFLAQSGDMNVFESLIKSCDFTLGEKMKIFLTKDNEGVTPIDLVLHEEDFFPVFLKEPSIKILKAILSEIPSRDYKERDEDSFIKELFFNKKNGREITEFFRGIRPKELLLVEFLKGVSPKLGAAVRGFFEECRQIAGLPSGSVAASNVSGISGATAGAGSSLV